MESPCRSDKCETASGLESDNNDPEQNLAIFGLKCETCGPLNNLDPIAHLPKHELECSTCRLISLHVITKLQKDWRYRHSRTRVLNDRMLVDLSRKHAGNPRHIANTRHELFHGAHGCEMGVLRHFKLCILCDHWLKHLLCVDWDDGDKMTIPMGTFSQLQARTECLGCQALCRFILEGGSKTNDCEAIIQLTIAQHWDGRITYKPNKWAHVSGALHIVPNEKKERKIAEFAVLYTKTAGKELAKETINWDRVNQWIEAFPVKEVPASRSSGIRRSKSYLPHGFCLISVNMACIVPMTGMDAPWYAALSYIWGNAEHELVATRRNFQELQCPGRLQGADVPPLIKDAMLACTFIGLDYLWVDRLCIVQDDMAAKVPQLEAMGQIYSKAFVTLVSPDDDGIRLGLAGVSQPRKPQVAVTFGRMTLMCFERTPSPLKESIWCRRGWTFQEGLLSKRLLVFGRDMLYMLRKPVDRRDSQALHFEGPREVEFRPEFLCGTMNHHNPASTYGSLVEAYTSRQFTYESDILNAFLGVLAEFGQQLYGFPLSLFNFAMLWEEADWNSPPRTSKDGLEFPSWSWISTHGTVVFRDRNDPPSYSLVSWAHVAESETDGLTIQLLDELGSSELQSKPWRMAEIETILNGARGEWNPVIIALAAMSAGHDGVSRSELNSIRVREAMNDPSFGKLKETAWFKALASYLEYNESALPGSKSRQILLRVARPPLTLSTAGLPQQKIRAALIPGRILARAPTLPVVLREGKRGDVRYEEGRHDYGIEYNDVLLGWVALTAFHHRELLSTISRGTPGEANSIRASCIALNIWDHDGELWKYRKFALEVSVMVVFDTLSGCSRRLGLSYVDLSVWLSCNATVETTILE